MCVCVSKPTSKLLVSHSIYVTNTHAHTHTHTHIYIIEQELL